MNGGLSRQLMRLIIGRGWDWSPLMLSAGCEGSRWLKLLPSYPSANSHTHAHPPLSLQTDLQINSLSPCDVQNRWFFSHSTQMDPFDYYCISLCVYVIKLMPSAKGCSTVGDRCHTLYFPTSCFWFICMAAGNAYLFKKKKMLSMLGHLDVEVWKI